MRDKLLLGLTDEGARCCLLREKDLTLTSAVGICRTAEIMDSKGNVTRQLWDWGEP